jgi:hypothetical protein
MLVLSRPWKFNPFSIKYAGQKDALIEVPKGANFGDMAALKGDKEIGEKINKVIARLKTFDFVVANFPFSTKSWSNGFDPAHDLYGRFPFGIPPQKNGDYAFLLHILASLKSTGKGAVIHPHGVLFRGGAEAAIRKEIVRRGRKVKDARKALDVRVAARYGKLSADELKTLVVDDKWLAALAAAVQGELDRVSQALTGRIRQLADRYACPLPQLAGEVEALAAKVAGHLERMGYSV